MNENTLKDLERKIGNLLHDFEHEHELHGLMAVNREGNRLIIEAKEMTAEEETHLRASGVVVPNESTYPHEAPLLNDGDAAGISQAVLERRKRMEETLRQTLEPAAPNATVPTPKHKPNSTI